MPTTEAAHRPTHPAVAVPAPVVTAVHADIDLLTSLLSAQLELHRLAQIGEPVEC